jgi:hypothetical protein
MKKQTAVEWLWLNLTDDMIGELSPEQIKSIYDLVQQTKAMEKEQSKTDFEKGQESTKFQFPLSSDTYYEETYGK